MFETGNLLDLQFEQVSCFVLSDLQLVLDADITQTIPPKIEVEGIPLGDRLLLTTAMSWSR